MAPFAGLASRRVAHGVAMYLLMCLAYSVVFNRVADGALRARIDDEVALALRQSTNLGPSDYANLRAAITEAKTRQYRLDEPLPSRIFWRTLDVATFHFGRSQSVVSATGDREVLAIVLQALPNTLALFGTEALLVMFLGGLVGIRAASKRNGPLDRAASVLPMVFNGLPTWWVGMIALMLFSYVLPIFPSGGVHANPAPRGWAGALDYLHHMALPLLTLVSLNLWNPAWLVRNLIGDIWHSDFVRFARAKGLPESRLAFHVAAAIRPALATMILLGLLQSLSGNILVEGIFGWPGLGGLYFAAVQQSDVPVLMGVLSLQTALNLAGLVALDLAYDWLDPRIRFGGSA